jgi:hypothetical protein
MLTILLACALAQTPPPPPTSPDEPETAIPVAERGTLEFDSRLPAEIRVDGQTVAQLYSPGTYRMQTAAGEHQVMVLTNGRAREITTEVTPVSTAVVLIGRNGLTTSARLEPLPEEDGIVPVELRSVGAEEVLVELAGKRYRLPPGVVRTITLPIGRHRMLLRSASGTVLWAKGRLVLERTSPVLLQFTEGRLPETSGPGATFLSGI